VSGHSLDTMRHRISHENYPHCTPDE